MTEIITLRIAEYRCACGNPDLIAIAPGHEGERSDLIGLLERPEPIRCFCLRCWPWRAKETAA